MIQCKNCGTNNKEGIRICLTCGCNLMQTDFSANDFSGISLDFDDREKLTTQIRDLFFRIMKYRVETELDTKAYRKYFDHFHSSGFYKNFDLRVNEITNEISEIKSDSDAVQQVKTDRWLYRVLNGLFDYFIIVHCVQLHKMKLPEAILRYENTDSEILEIRQMILDFLDFVHERDTVYTRLEGIPPANLDNAKASFFFTGSDETFVFLSDQTVFGNCKEGFAMTDKSLYWKTHFNEASAVRFEKLSQIKRESEWITINGLFFNVNKTMNFKMLLLLKKLREVFS